MKDKCVSIKLDASELKKLAKLRKSLGIRTQAGVLRYLLTTAASEN